MFEQVLANIVLAEEIQEDPAPATLEEIVKERRPSEKLKRPRTVIMVDDQRKVILDNTIPKEPKTKIAKQKQYQICIQEQRTVPWLEGYVANIYIRPVNISSKTEKYIHRNRSIKVDITTGPSRRKR